MLDLGCGNGWLAHELANRNHRGSYLGVDFSPPMLREAESIPKKFSAKFLQIDLSTLDNSSLRQAQDTAFILPLSSFDIVSSFATLHHIPSREFRLNILCAVHDLLKPTGLFIHSNWQFLNSEKLKARIQPWEVAAVSKSDVDADDYLLDWRSGGEGLRYVHHFNEHELQELAEKTGFQVMETFFSDGEGGNLGLYQVWKPTV
jgi:SAM-dependent methyltransferase